MTRRPVLASTIMSVGLLALASQRAAMAVSLQQDQYFPGVLYAPLTTPDHYLVQAADRWSVVDNNNNVDPTYLLLITVSVAQSSTGSIQVSDTESSAGGASAIATIQDVAYSAWATCYTGLTDLTVTPFFGSPVGYPETTIGTTCLPAPPPTYIASCWDFGAGWVED
jgi:hypothetical protein